MCFGTYIRAPFVLERGAGMWVYDTEGRAYWNSAQGLASTTWAIAIRVVVAAVTDQVTRLSHTCNLYHTAPQADLAEMLCRSSFADKVYFANSGAEAIEAAIKFCPHSMLSSRTVPGKTGIVAFHGRFTGAPPGRWP